MAKKGKATRLWISVLFSALVSAALVAAVVQSGYAQTAAKPIKLTYALFQPATAALSKTNTAFAQEIEKRSNGRVQITVHQSGSLLSAPAMYQGIRNGIADMGNGISSYNPGNFPFTQLVELPSAAESGWAVSNAYFDFFQKFQLKEWSDVHLLTVCGPSFGIMLVGTGKAPIHTLEQLKGKSLRTNFADYTAALGATVKDLPMTEVYDSISKGVLDGVQTNSEPLKSWKLGDVTKYITLFFGPVMPSNVIYNAMNKNKWNSLPPDIQKIFMDVSREYSAKLGLTWDEQLVQGLEYAKSAGDTIYVLPKDEAARWSAAVTPLIDKRLKTIVAQGFPQKEVDDGWSYFNSRVAYWNAQQASHNVVPVQAQMEALLKK